MELPCVLLALYLGGRGDFQNRRTMRLSGSTTWVIRFKNVLTKSSSMVQGDLNNAFSGSAKCLEFGYCPNPVTVYIRSPIKGYI